MATSPYLPTPVNSPLDPLARPNVAPAPPVSPADALINKYKNLPWVGGAENEANWRNYLTGPSGLNGANTPYWEQRMRDAPGMGSNAAPKTRTMSSPTTDLSRPGAQQSDLFAQVLAELQAQQNGEPSPTERDVHLRMLRGQ
jgi:hypothetical protein